MLKLSKGPQSNVCHVNSTTVNTMKKQNGEQTDCAYKEKITKQIKSRTIQTLKYKCIEYKCLHEINRFCKCSLMTLLAQIKWCQL